MILMLNLRLSLRLSLRRLRLSLRLHRKELKTPRAVSKHLPPEPEAALDEVLDMMACKAAIKAGDRLSDSELEDLLAQREAIERSTNCPHGRPTTIRIPVEDLERRFHRR